MKRPLPGFKVGDVAPELSDEERSRLAKPAASSPEFRSSLRERLIREGKLTPGDQRPPPTSSHTRRSCPGVTKDTSSVVLVDSGASCIGSTPKKDVEQHPTPTGDSHG